MAIAMDSYLSERFSFVTVGDNSKLYSVSGFSEKRWNGFVQPYVNRQELAELEAEFLGVSMHSVLEYTERGDLYRVNGLQFWVA